MNETGSLVLTVKGAEELKARVRRLDARARNILFLIHMGSQNLEAILEKTIFPPNEVATKVYALLEAQFITMNFGHTSSASASLPPVKAPPRAPVVAVLPILLPGVSLSQTRFALSDFCLDCFGVDAERLMAAIDRCTDLGSLQQVLNNIFNMVQQDRPDQLSGLYLRVNEINAAYR